MLIFRATSLKYCYLHVLNFYLDNGVMTTPKRRILSFDIKVTWKILNCAKNRTKCKPIKISWIQEHGVTVTDSEEIANRFCNYFADVCPNLASKIIPVFKSSNECLTVVLSSPPAKFWSRTNKRARWGCRKLLGRQSSWTERFAFVYH